MRTRHTSTGAFGVRLAALIGALATAGACTDSPTAPTASTAPPVAAARARDISITELGAFEAVAIAPNGRVAVNVRDASSPSPRHAGIWFHGVVTDLPVVGTVGVGQYAFADATDINADGQVVGWGETPQERQVAIRWIDGVPSVLPSPEQSRYNHADAINSDGDVVGTVDISGSFFAPILRAVLWRNGQPLIELGTLGGIESRAHGINDDDQVVGGSFTSSGQFHAFRWEAGSMLDLGTLGGSFSSANDINARGQVVGSSTTAAGQTHAFLWTDGVMTDLGTLGGTTSVAYGINARGEVVGSSTTAGGSTHAFLWYKGVMIDLGTLGGPFSAAYDISESGRIVGESNAGAVLWTVK